MKKLLLGLVLSLGLTSCFDEREVDYNGRIETYVVSKVEVIEPAKGADYLKVHIQTPTNTESFYADLEDRASFIERDTIKVLIKTITIRESEN